MTEFVLSEALLDNCAGRAAEYDRENRFFFEDLEELRAASTCSLRCREISAVSDCRSARYAWSSAAWHGALLRLRSL